MPTTLSVLAISRGAMKLARVLTCTVPVLVHVEAHSLFSFSAARVMGLLCFTTTSRYSISNLQ